MIKHIVLFKFIPFEDESIKVIKMKEIKEGLENLIHSVPSLVSIEVGINTNPDEEYDMVLNTSFNTWDDLKQYAVHPHHVAVAKIIGAIKAQRACVDYEF